MLTSAIKPCAVPRTFPSSIWFLWQYCVKNWVHFFHSVLQLLSFVCALKSGKLQDSDIYSLGMPDTSLLPLIPTHGFEFPYGSKGEDSQSHLAGADIAIAPVWRRRGLHLLPPWGMRRRWEGGYVGWCATSSSLGLPQGLVKGKWYLGTFCCGESVCKLPALQQPTILTLCNIKVYKWCQRELFSEESWLMQF